MAYNQNKDQEPDVFLQNVVETPASQFDRIVSLKYISITIYILLSEA